MAVGSRLGDRRPAEIAAGARTVFDDELFAEILAQRVRNGARQRVDGRAGRERHDHGDRTARPLLRDGVVTWCNGKCEAYQAEREQAHVSSELRTGSRCASAYSAANLSRPLRDNHLDNSSATASLLRSAKAMWVLPRSPASGSSRTSQSPP